MIELTGGQVGNLHAFEEIARYIARRNKKRLEKYALGPTPERLALREALFTWSHNNGHAWPIP